jgi:hypothetical protein
MKAAHSKKDATSTSETSLNFYQTTQRNNPKTANVNE